MMDVVWEVGAADEKVSQPASSDVADKGTSLASSSVPAGGDDVSAVDAGEVNGREAAFFTIVHLLENLCTLIIFLNYFYFFSIKNIKAC